LSDLTRFLYIFSMTTILIIAISEFIIVDEMWGVMD